MHVLCRIWMYEAKVIFEPSSHSPALSSVQMNVKGRPRARGCFCGRHQQNNAEKRIVRWTLFVFIIINFAGPNRTKNHSTIRILPALIQSVENLPEASANVFLEPNADQRKTHEKIAHNSETSEEKTSKRIQVESQSVLFALSASSWKTSAADAYVPHIYTISKAYEARKTPTCHSHTSRRRRRREVRVDRGNALKELWQQLHEKKNDVKSSLNSKKSNKKRRYFSRAANTRTHAVSRPARIWIINHIHIFSAIVIRWASARP